jgi:hypothetical protein
MSDITSAVLENAGILAGRLPPRTPGLAEMIPVSRQADLWLYRERTIALLRRYLRISIEVGRLPSLLGRELFRSKVTSYRMSSFEDAVIFVYDVESAIAHLSKFRQQLVTTIIFHDYTQRRSG